MWRNILKDGSMIKSCYLQKVCEDRKQIYLLTTDEKLTISLGFRNILVTPVVLTWKGCNE